MSAYGESAYGEVPYGGLAGESLETNEYLFVDAVTLIAEMVGSVQYLVESEGSITVTEGTDILDGMVFLAIASMSVGAVTEFSKAVAMLNAITVGEAHSASVVGMLEILEPLSTEAKVQFATQAYFEDAVSATDRHEVRELAYLIDALVINGVVGTHLQGAQLVAQAIAIVAEAGLAKQHIFVDVVGMTAAILTNYITNASQIENMTIADSAVGMMTVSALVDEALSMSGSATYAQQLVALIQEQVTLGISLRLGNDVFAAWLVNPATGGASRYDNFPFNSMTKAYGKYIGCAETGLYLMEGSDDDGTKIAASFKTGLSNFGERRQKRINDVFLGVLTSGDLVLKVVADEQGSRTEYWYDVVQHGDADNHRVKVGKGLKATYWGFELVNKDGADFDLDNLQLYPLTLSRRV